MSRSPSYGIVLAGAFVVLAAASGLALLLMETEPPFECPSCGGRVHPKAYITRWPDGWGALSVCCWARRDDQRSVSFACKERTSQTDANWMCNVCDRSWTMHRDRCSESTTPMMIRRARSLLGIVR